MVSGKTPNFGHVFWPPQLDVPFLKRPQNDLFWPFCKCLKTGFSRAGRHLKNTAMFKRFQTSDEGVGCQFSRMAVHFLKHTYTNREFEVFNILPLSV